MRRWRTVAATLVILATLALLGSAVFIYSGIYDVAALDQHGRFTNWLLHSVALNSIERRARGVRVPELSDPAKVARGSALYRQDCVQCHGAPGTAPAAFAMGFMPGVPPIVQVAREWPANEIYWVVGNGLKMTAMPPWRHRMTDDELWDIVAFVETLPKLSTADYQAQINVEDRAVAVSGGQDGSSSGVGDPQRGKLALQQYACAACHIIPGVVAPAGRIGPSLAGMNERSIVAGLKANTSDNMIEWIRHPERVSPWTAMPDMGVTEQDARDMAAYLGTL